MAVLCQEVGKALAAVQVLACDVAKGVPTCGPGRALEGRWLISCVAGQLVDHLVANAAQVALLAVAESLHHQVVARHQAVHLGHHVLDVGPAQDEAYILTVSGIEYAAAT